jgi:hypothetical protein
LSLPGRRHPADSAPGTLRPGLTSAVRPAGTSPSTRHSRPSASAGRRRGVRRCRVGLPLEPRLRGGHDGGPEILSWVPFRAVVRPMQHGLAGASNKDVQPVRTPGGHARPCVEPPRSSHTLHRGLCGDEVGDGVVGSSLAGLGGGAVPPAVARMIKKRPVLQQDYPAQDHRQRPAAPDVDHEE